ncbi:MAG: cytochrome c3 family protein [bacterium]|nr:cytochrome c3 family protein [bacterium]
MNVTKKLLVSLLLIVGLGLLKASGVSAAITGSPHDLVSWLNITSKDKAGICAYCHVPHSSKGDRLFPLANEEEKLKYGVVGSLCSKCHVGSGYLNYPNMDVNNEIFATLDPLVTPLKNTHMDSHPVFGTRSSHQSATLQNTNLDSAISNDWPWTSSWAAGAKPDKDIECSSCHNPHDWNPIAFGSDAVYGLAKRKFLRAPVYNENGPANNKNFCSYCHINREADTSSNNIGGYGTHPVSSGRADTASFTGNPGAVRDEVYMFRNFYGSTNLVSGNRAGRAIWDSGWAIGTTAVFLGARTYGNDLICQSCHMPHGVMHTDDDTYHDSATTELHVGPLLAVDNAWSFADAAPGFAPTKSEFPFKSETVFVLPATHEENILCEWCHGLTPDLDNTLQSTNAFAHPVDKYPPETSGVVGVGTLDNIASEPEFGSMDIRYPPSQWLKYRESGGIRGVTGNPTHTQNTDRTTDGKYLTCLSCHEPHQAAINSPILKRGMERNLAGRSDTTFCDGCHSDVAVGTGADTAYFTDWTTHPSGPAATLVTGDAEGNGNIKFPNRAGLKTFNKGTTAEYISCWSCHKAHKGVEKPLLADYQTPFSQICVNCHTPGDTVYVSGNGTGGLGGSKAAAWKYGRGSGSANGETDANPSYYYIEGAGATGTPWWNYTNKRGYTSAGDTTSAPNAYGITAAGTDSTRLGSHYIGQFSGTRPTINTADSCWLGERNIDRNGASGAILTTIDRRRGSVGGTGEAKDRWLDTAGFIGRYWASTDSSGSGQKGHYGTTATGEYVISCQGCHVAHNSGVGVADNPKISRLLLAPNVDSYMCKRCHIPEVTVGDTTFTHLMSADTSGAAFDSGNLSYKITKLEGDAVNITTSKFAYNNGQEIAPANYAGGRMNCDGCHTVHNADSKMGAMILEGDSATISGTFGTTGLWNKVPTIPERDDNATCRLCHKYGAK